MLEQPRRGQLVEAGEDGERDRKVEPEPSLRSAAGARLTVILVLPGHASIALTIPLLDAMLRLLAGAVGEPDDRERRQVGADEVRLDLDAARLEADDGGGEGACEHAFDARRNTVVPARVNPACRAKR